jgi:DNA-binding MarR family transcriptional regulator
VNDATKDAREFSELFPALYLRFHRRGRVQPEVGPQAWAVLQHLAWSGPLTVTEAAKHMERAQSVVSEIFESLEGKELVMRMPDARDRRRTLVWLTDAGQALLEEERQVLSLELLEPAIACLSAEVRRGLIDGMRALSEVEAKRKEKKK